MVCGFKMGDDWWTVHPVPPSSPSLVDRTGRLTVATTDPASLSINVSTALYGARLRHVLIHEAAHAAMASYGITERLAAYVPAKNRIAVEEMICNILADHGLAVLSAAASMQVALRSVKNECMLEYAV